MWNWKQPVWLLASGPVVCQRMTLSGRALALKTAGQSAWWFWLRLHYNGIVKCTRVRCIIKRTFLTFHLLFSCSKCSEMWCMVSFCMTANEESLWHDIMLPKPLRVSVETIALGSGWTVWPTWWSTDCQGCALLQFLSAKHACGVHGFSFLWNRSFGVCWKWHWTCSQKLWV